MAPDRDALREDLLAVMDRKNHWAWAHFEDGRATRDQLLVHFQQEWEVYVRDFPVLLSRVHSVCPHPEVRRDIAENLFEEETGKLSGSGPHPDLFLHMMKGLGFSRTLFREVRMLPEANAYRTWIDQVTTGSSWLEGAALVTLFIEGSVHERRYLEGKAPAGAGADEEARTCWLARHYGVAEEFLELKRAHGRIEGEHRGAAWRMVLDHATGPRAAERVVRVMRRALDLWLRYRDGVARACGIPGAAGGI
jgi:pyrroloquinoline-quinone synthase